MNYLIENVIIRMDDKPTPGNIAMYNGNARPGEIVIDPTVIPPLMYLGDKNGNLVLQTGGGGGGYSDANVVALLNAFGSNVINTTGVVTAGGFSTTGNANAGTFNGGSLNILGFAEFTGQANIATLRVTGSAILPDASNVSIGGGSNGQVLTTDGAGNLSWTTPTATATLPISNGTSNIDIATANGDITFSSAGNANILTISGTGITVSGISILGGNADVKILGGIPGQALTTDGLGNLSWASPAAALPLANGTSNVNIPVANGPVTISANGVTNVASFLDSDITFVASNVNLGGNANVKITGGTAGQALVTDGAGNLSWATPAVVHQPAIEWIAPADGAGQVFNDANLATFASPPYPTLYVNGSLVRSADYNVVGTNLIVLRFLLTGDEVTIGAI